MNKTKATTKKHNNINKKQKNSNKTDSFFIFYVFSFTSAGGNNEPNPGSWCTPCAGSAPDKCGRTRTHTSRTAARRPRPAPGTAQCTYSSTTQTKHTDVITRYVLSHRNKQLGHLVLVVAPTTDVRWKPRPQHQSTCYQLSARCDSPCKKNTSSVWHTR